MLQDSKAFSSFSVDDLDAAKTFYTDALGLDVEEMKGMGFTLKTAGGPGVFVYPKDDHEPASHTVLNFLVDDIDKAVEALADKGVTFEQLDLGGGAKTDEKGVMRGKDSGDGPNIAWFKDPAGNTFALMTM